MFIEAPTVRLLFRSLRTALQSD